MVRRKGHGEPVTAAGATACVRWAEARAAQLLRRHRPAVRALALALLSEGRQLTGADVRRLIDRARPAHFA